jgi:hypothetical protein
MIFHSMTRSFESALTGARLEARQDCGALA